MFDLATVKAWLNKTDTVRDDVLQELMDRALEAVQRNLDWYFGTPRDTSEILNGTGRARMWLHQPPVDDAVVAYEREGVGYDWVVIDPTLWETNGREVLAAGIFTSGFRNFRFDYEEGFATMPGDIEQLLLDMVKQKWNEGERAGIVSETLGRYSYSLGDLETAPGWTQVVNTWRRMRA